jgi:hypothetical protein
MVARRDRYLAARTYAAQQEFVQEFTLLVVLNEERTQNTSEMVPPGLEDALTSFITSASVHTAWQFRPQHVKLAVHSAGTAKGVP